MKYRADFSIGLDDIDKNSKCKDKMFLKFFEDIACFHSDSLGRGIADLDTTRKAWALLDWELKILERPSYGNKITVDTWSRKCTRTYAYRDFILYANDKPAVYASSKWFTLNIDKRCPVRITEEDIAPFQSEDESILGIDEMDRLQEMPFYEESSEYTVLKSNIDVLGHMHNTHYLDLLYGMLTDEEIDSIRNIRISYKKELSLNDKATIYKHFENGTYYFAIKTNDDKTINALAVLS